LTSWPLVARLVPPRMRLYLEDGSFGVARDALVASMFVYFVYFSCSQFLKFGCRPGGVTLLVTVRSGAFPCSHGSFSVVVLASFHSSG
jgi:hypothetical protein